MRRNIWISTIFILLCIFIASKTTLSSREESSEIRALNFIVPQEYISENQNWNNITIVIYNPEENIYTIYNKDQANMRLSPCSTFKIPHSLIALDEGVLINESSEYAWDGTVHSVESWNQDHTLKSAISNSVVWYFQNVAKEIGVEAMQNHLDRLEYGNQDISGGMDGFWLKSSLEISAIEQIDFMDKLYENELPFSVEHQELVKELLVLDKRNGKVLSGKTGGGSGIGWFVGCVENKGAKTFIALNMINRSKASGENAKQLSFEVLEDLGIY